MLFIIVHDMAFTFKLVETTRLEDEDEDDCD